MIEKLIEFLRELHDVKSLVQTVGYLGLHIIVFAETGLLVGFFLPGDSLLVTAGIFAANGDLNVWILLFGLSLAAIAGDQTGYLIGRKAGKALYSRPDSILFKKKHLQAAHDFYEKYGPKTIVLARFVPIIRTFAPTVAGAAEMEYRKFVTFNILGGILWVFSTVGGGFLLGKAIPDLDKHIHKIIVIVVFLSILPILYEGWKHRKGSRGASPETPSA